MISGEEPAPGGARALRSSGEIVGTWVSEVRQTIRGTMSFVFRFGNDGHLDINGTPVGAATGEVFSRNGLYRAEDDR
jgi:hypothetical protein